MVDRKRRTQPPIWLPEGARARRKGARLTVDDELAILGGLAEGRTFTAIAKALSAVPRTVSNYWKKIVADPTWVFHLPVIHQTGRKGHQCELCAECLPTRIKAMRHVLAHLLPDDIAKHVPLSHIPKPL